ncbi:hypothetical protein Zmor_013467 [Zophobas morio]|uniref:Uncharacterized protein n=1 Tax=Zophobas morio TaxID=2755281 RepID=A0AA38IIJ6_9CUCU|nr:hypothetical protein Zmor_013467 [Zophobas morio]
MLDQTNLAWINSLNSGGFANRRRLIFYAARGLDSGLMQGCGSRVAIIAVIKDPTLLILFWDAGCGHLDLQKRTPIGFLWTI